MNLPPVIVGAGVCGLTAALALSRERHKPTVYERESGPPQPNTGILIGTNGVRVLYHLGLAETVAEAGQPIRRARILDADGRTLSRWQFAEFEGRVYDWTPVSVTRDTLLTALEGALPDGTVEYGRECTGTAHQSGEEQVQFADGDAVQSSLVIGADGVRSTVRRSLFPEASVRPTGRYAYHGVANDRFEAHLRPEVWEVWGPATRVRFASVGPDRVGWTVLADDTLGPGDRPGDRLSALSERCDVYPEPVRTLFARTPPESVAVEPVLEMRPLDRWHGGAIVLAGDAAHASVPWLGYDIGFAMTDGYAIAERLRGAKSVEGGLKAYQSDRKPTVDWFCRRSRQLLAASTVESSTLRAARNLVARSVPERTTHGVRRRLAAIG